MVILLHREDMYERGVDPPRRGRPDRRQAPQRPHPRDHRGVPGPLLALRRHGALVPCWWCQDAGVHEAPSVVVLDGGLSTALEELGADLGCALWTARLLGDDPQLVVAAHRAYFAAGAQVATRPATRRASPPRGRGVRRGRGRSAHHVERHPRPGGSRRGSADSDRGLLVAASVGPYGAVLADGSEYRGSYGLSASELRDFHAPRLELLAASAPDLFAVETIPDVDEALVLVELLDEVGVPAWFTYSVREGRDVRRPAAVRGVRALAGVVVDPRRRRQLLAPGRRARCGARPASPPRACRRSPTPTRAAAGTARPAPGRARPAWICLREAWVAAGARYVGGCCGTGPADIEALARDGSRQGTSAPRGPRVVPSERRARPRHRMPVPVPSRPGRGGGRRAVGPSPRRRSERWRHRCHGPSWSCGGRPSHAGRRRRPRTAGPSARSRPAADGGGVVESWRSSSGAVLR